MGLADQVGSVEQAVEIDELRQALVRAQQAEIKAKARTEHLVEAVVTASRDAVLALKPPKTPSPVKRDKRAKSGEAALWHLTDWQGSKVTTSYNSDVMRERVMLFVDKAERITQVQRADHPVRECVIAFGGDMVEGLFNFPTQPFEIDQTIFGQFVTVSKLIVDVVERALSIYEKVSVVSEWGNHGRMGSKRDAIPKSDNIDRMCYEMGRQLTQGWENLSWEDSPEDIQRIEIGNYRALVMHGDEVGRQGFASPSAWQAAGNRWKAGAYGWDFQDIYLGHYHRHAQEPLSDGLGAIYWTGSTESDNRYARDSMAASGVPSQRLHFIDPEEGRVTAGYQVWLDA